jgi:hypothetical protein
MMRSVDLLSSTSRIRSCFDDAGAEDGVVVKSEADEVPSAGCDAVLSGRKPSGGLRCRNGSALVVASDAAASPLPWLVNADNGVPRGERGDREPECEGETDADVGEVDSEDDEEKGGEMMSSSPLRSASRWAEKATSDARSVPTSAVNSVSSNPREYTCMRVRIGLLIS